MAGATKTVYETIETPLECVDVVATLPAPAEVSSGTKKLPISLVVGASKSPLLCYHYAVPYKQDVVGSVLVDSADDAVRDVTRQLATLVAKKFRVPCYVGWGCASASDQLLVISKCIQLIKLHTDSPSS